MGVATAGEPAAVLLPNHAPPHHVGILGDDHAPDDDMHHLVWPLPPEDPSIPINRCVACACSGLAQNPMDSFVPFLNLSHYPKHFRLLHPIRTTNPFRSGGAIYRADTGEFHKIFIGIPR